MVRLEAQFTSSLDRLHRPHIREQSFLWATYDAYSGPHHDEARDEMGIVSNLMSWQYRVKHTIP